MDVPDDPFLVFLLVLDYLASRGWSAEQIANLVYAGITRARHRLVIPYTRQTPIIERLLDAAA
jgi:hypothetical protein